MHIYLHYVHFFFPFSCVRSANLPQNQRCILSSFFYHACYKLRRGNKNKEKVYPNFFLTECNMNMHKIQNIVSILFPIFCFVFKLYKSTREKFSKVYREGKAVPLVPTSYYPSLISTKSDRLCCFPNVKYLSKWRMESLIKWSLKRDLAGKQNQPGEVVHCELKLNWNEVVNHKGRGGNILRALIEPRNSLA